MKTNTGIAVAGIWIGCAIASLGGNSGDIIFMYALFGTLAITFFGL